MDRVYELKIYVVGILLKDPEESVGKPQKKVLFFVARPLRRGGGGYIGRATKEKKDFFLMFFFNFLKFLLPLSRGGWGRKGLSGRATKNKNFFAASLIDR